MMPRRLSALAGLMALSGCGTLAAHRARTQLVGAAEPDIVACMGVPSAKLSLGTDQSVLQWEYAQTGTDLDVEFGIYSLKLGRPGICRTAIRFDKGRVKSVHYAGVDVTPTDPDSICGRLVKDCLTHRETTPLPPDFQNQTVFIDPKPASPS